MPKTQIIRIIHVRPTGNGKQIIGYYTGDMEQEMEWTGTAPSIGDVYALTPPAIPRKLAGSHPGTWKSDSNENDVLRWRKPISPGGISRIEVLKRRHVIRQAVREYLNNAGYIEIDAPLLVRGTTPDPAVASFHLEDRYLATSTEYQMKRLAIGGMEKIYSLTQNFRPGDNSTFRNPEFTMLEWGGIDVPLSAIESDIEKFTQAAMRALDLGTTLTYQGQKIDISAPWERLSVAEAIHKMTGVDVKNFDAASYYRAAQAAGIDLNPAWAEDGDFLFSLLMDHIQPQLGCHRPLFLREWPLYQTTSAQTLDEKTSDRSELFIAGIELSDGFAAVADAGLQQQLFDYALMRRQSTGMAGVELDHKYIDAIRLGVPHGAGMALGFDRLVMLLTDQSHIKKVLALAWDEL